MSDLSKVLGDLYGEANPDERSVRQEPAASQRIGEISGAEPSEELSETEAAKVDEDLAVALSEALATRQDSEHPSIDEAEEWAEHFDRDDVHERAIARSHLRHWQRSYDDIIPGRAKGKRRKH